jgi:ABC-type multidrug transport system fused ATPase/permease subunit
MSIVVPVKIVIMSKSSSATKSAQYSSWQLIRDIWALMDGLKGKFLLGTLLRLISDLVILFPQFAIALVIEFFINYRAGEDTSILFWLMGGFVLSVLIRASGQFLGKFYGYQVAESIGIKLTLKSVQHLFLLDMVWHEKENAGNKVKRIQNASEAVNKITRLWFDCIVEICVNIIGINLIIASFDRTVLVLLLTFLLIYFVLSRQLTKKAALASYAVNAQEENVSGLLFEATSNIRTLKVMTMGETLMTMLRSSTNLLYQKIQHKILTYQSRNSILGVWGGIAKAGIMTVIILGVLRGQYSVAFLVLFNSYFTNIRESIDEFASITQDFISGRFSMMRLKAVLDQPITIDSEVNKRVFPKDWQEIAFKKVSFAYGSNKVLKNISFTVKRGEKVGIVGLSGAGKSTILKLLLKEREEFTGDILFDGLSIKDISKNAYFQNVSVVLQDTEVFNFSLRDNITITNANKKKNAKLFKQSLEIAHITDLVQKLPQGLATIIGEKGVKLSGGERQRLGIARAIFKQPQILLLDEATSHLDLESEEKIRDSLHQFFENVTAIVIAHRLSTIREMDKILVIEDGKLIESGSFNQLIKLKGRFFKLWQKQGL